MQQPAIEPVTGALRVVDGAPLEDAAPYVAALSSPPEAVRGREDEHLFLLLDLSDPASSQLYRELREVAARTYWSASGSITSALRRAAAAFNRYLFEFNLNSRPSERCYGGLACAVLRGEDLFMLEAGSARACVFQGKHLVCFPQDERLAPLGIGPLADVRLHHVFIDIGDTLLLASPALVREAGEKGLTHVLSRAKMEEVLTGLEPVGSRADFTALVVRWREMEAPTAQEVPPVRESIPLPGPEGPMRHPAESEELRERPERLEPSRRAAREQPRARDIRPIPRRRRPARKPRPGLGERVRGGLRYLGRGLRYVGRGIAAAGTGIVAFGKWLASAIGRLLMRTLPGTGQPSRRRPSRRPPPEENRALMIAVAIGLPILMAIIVAIAHFQLRTESRFQGVIRQAEEEAALAQALEDRPGEARSHWEAALGLAETAAALQPGAQSAAALQAQSQAALDRLDKVKRLTPTQLTDFGSPNVARQLIVRGRMLFAFDPTDSWVAHVSLNQAGSGTTEEEPTVVVHTGQQVDGERVGKLVDCVWVGPGSGRQTSALVILEEKDTLLSYDPAWESEEGAPQLRRSFLGVPPPGEPRAVGSFEGRFYVLDAIADGSGQIWRYRPRGGAYPDQPERYFTDPPPERLTNARDMAIDGHIYVLFADGRILKFLRGEPQPFEVRDVPGDISQVVAFAVDPDGSGVVYLADRGNDRIISLEPDGAFRAQFRADGAFDALEALAVDEAAGRLYVLSGGRLYTASLP